MAAEFTSEAGGFGVGDSRAPCGAAGFIAGGAGDDGAGREGARGGGFEGGNSRAPCGGADFIAGGSGDDGADGEGARMRAPGEDDGQAERAGHDETRPLEGLGRIDPPGPGEASAPGAERGVAFG